MEAIDFKGRNILIAEDQKEYKTLPAMVIPGPEAPVVTCWDITDDDLEEIKKNRKVYLMQLTFGQSLQPINMQSSLDGFFELGNSHEE